MHRLLQGSEEGYSFSNVNADKNKDLLDIDTIMGLLIDKLQSSAEEIHVLYE